MLGRLIGNTAATRKKVYIDTNIISSWVKTDIPVIELMALDSILDAWQTGLIDLYTSRVAGEELDRVPERYRLPHLRLYKLIRLVPSAVEFRTDSGLSLLGVGGGRRIDPDYTRLLEYLDEQDARHVFQAFKNQVETFLTVDRGIVKQRERIRSDFYVDVMKPSEFRIPA